MEAMKNEYNILSRSELDARNSSSRPKSLNEILANKMNDDNYNPKSRVLPDLHYTFLESRDLSKKKCMSANVTPDQVKSKRADIRVKLMKAVADFEKSGNGEGNLAESDDKWEGRDITHPDYDKFDRNRYINDLQSDFVRHGDEIVLYK